GHIPFGLHAYLPQPALYVTQLREPIQVSLSSYFYFELFLRAREQQREIEWTMPTLQALRESKMHLMYNNLQTRHMSDNLGASMGGVTRAMLDQAKENLAQFAIVGLTEK